MDELLLRVDKGKRKIKMDLLDNLKIPVTNGYGLVHCLNAMQHIPVNLDNLIGVVAPKGLFVDCSLHDPCEAFPVDFNKDEPYEFCRGSRVHICVDSDYDDAWLSFGDWNVKWTSLEGFVMGIYCPIYSKRDNRVVFVFKRQ